MELHWFLTLGFELSVVPCGIVGVRKFAMLSRGSEKLNKVGAQRVHRCCDCHVVLGFSGLGIVECREGIAF